MHASGDAENVQTTDEHEKLVAIQSEELNPHAEQLQAAMNMT